MGERIAVGNIWLSKTCDGWWGHIEDEGGGLYLENIHKSSFMPQKGLDADLNDAYNLACELNEELLRVYEDERRDAKLERDEWEHYYNTTRGVP